MVNNAAGQPVLYVFGGNDPLEGFPVDPIEAYNYGTDTWTTKASRLPRGVYYMNGVGVIGGKLYPQRGLELHTGDGVAAVQTMYAYDPVSDRLIRKADIPRPSSGGAAGVINGKLYLLIGSGGDFGDATSRRFYRYNPATNTWTSLPSCPHVHRYGAAAVSQGKFYVAGGFDGAAYRRTLDMYDPVTNSWTTRAPLPSARSDVAGVALLGKFYVIGGGKTVFVYDPVTNTWRTRASLPTSRFGLAAAPLVTPSGNSKILAVGGFNSSDTTAASANELYTP